MQNFLNAKTQRHEDAKVLNLLPEIPAGTIRSARRGRVQQGWARRAERGVHAASASALEVAFVLFPTLPTSSVVKRPRTRGRAPAFAPLHCYLPTSARPAKIFPERGWGEAQPQPARISEGFEMFQPPSPTTRCGWSRTTQPRSLGCALALPSASPVRQPTPP